MSCAKPLKLTQYCVTHSSNKLYPSYKETRYTFGSLPKGAQFMRNIEIPCNYCLNCRIDKRNYLEDICNEEYKNKGYATFLTLTYDNDSILPNLKYNLENELVASLEKKMYNYLLKD